jgi:hypothetical protein
MWQPNAGTSAPSPRPRRKRPAPRPHSTAPPQTPDSRDNNRAARAPYEPGAPRTGVTPAFRTGTPSKPFGVSNKPLGVQVNRQTRATRGRQRRLPDHPAIPSIPVKGSYTPAEVQAIKDAYKRGARQIGGRNFVDLYQVGSLRQRRQMRQIARTINEQQAAAAAHVTQTTGVPVGRDTARPPTPQEIQGSLVPASVGRFLDEHTQIPDHPGASLFDLANVPIQLGRVTAEHPTDVARASLRTGVESIAGIPQGVKGIVHEIRKDGLKKGLSKSLDAIAKDYERRYGPIFNDPARFREQVRKDYGLTPFVFDAASLGVPAGRAATRARPVRSCGTCRSGTQPRR